MRPAGKLREHLARVFASARLAQYMPVEHHLSVRRNNNRRPDSTRRDKLRLSIRQSLHQFRRRFTRNRSFVNSRREHSERQPGIMQNFSAANRSGSKNQFHAAYFGEGYYRRGKFEAFGFARDWKSRNASNAANAKKGTAAVSRSRTSSCRLS